MLSLTTKVLWLKMKWPIIIYDRQARKEIGTPVGDLEGFYTQWRKGFQLRFGKIATVCRKLGRMGAYSVNERIATSMFIHKVASTRWFHERAFDIYLWCMGAD